jgi:putative ABC transport system substrate-binding protein
MKRRTAGIALAGFMYGVRAARVPPRIGRLSEGGPATADTLDGFRKAMRELGHADVEIVSRHAGGQYGNLPGLAAELAALGVDVIWTVGTIATGAAKEATRTIPVVMLSADAVGSGLVDSMARPGGNVTGLTLIATELVRKRLELIKELNPGTRRVIGFCTGPGALSVPLVVNWVRESKEAARKLRLRFELGEASPSPDDWDAMFASLAAVPGTALSPIESPFLLQHRVLLADLSLKHQLPAVYALQEHVRAGGLCCYGVNRRFLFERVAYYIARILNGAKPADLPVEQPTRYEPLVNLKSARAMGLAVSQSLMLRADEVIE